MAQTKKHFKALAISLAVGALASGAKAQQNWQSWNSLNVSAAITKKLDVQIGHTKAYGLSGGTENVFNQTLFQVRYDLTKRWDLSGGLQFIDPTGPAAARTRIFIRAAHTTRINELLNWTNSLRIETNSRNENRFRQRFIVSTRLGLRKRLDFLNLSPSVMYSLFYNMGGTPIRYYNESKELVARQTPDGFHRGRITFNLSSKINDYVRVSVFYMRQHEFNFLVGENRRMNVFDPVRNRTLRPFNNFNVIGLSLNVSLDELIPL
jgi:Protein of unknown function (DUF2490)